MLSTGRWDMSKMTNVFDTFPERVDAIPMSPKGVT